MNVVVECVTCATKSVQTYSSVSRAKQNTIFKLHSEQGHEVQIVNETFSPNGGRESIVLHHVNDPTVALIEEIEKYSGEFRRDPGLWESYENARDCSDEESLKWILQEIKKLSLMP